MPTTYTSPYGNTNQGAALASAQPNSVNTVPPPGSHSSAYGSDQMLNSQLLEANAANVTLGTADKRQQYMTNSNLPAMSQNYDQLARQLFEFDQGVLAPKFQGTNPGMPSDAPAFGRVEASPLGMTVEGAKLSADKGLYAGNNPQGAYQAQISQGDSIATLLNTLVNGMTSEFGARVGTYRSDRQAAQSAVDLIRGLMQDKQTALDREASRASFGGLEGQKLNDAKSRLLADAKKGVTFTDLVLRYTPDGLTSSEIRELYNQVNYYKKPARESESDVLKLIQEGKKPSALSGDRLKLTNNAKSALADLDKIEKMASMDQLLLSELPGGLGARDFMAARNNAMDVIARLRTGAAMNKSEEKLYKRYLPELGDDEKTIKNKISRLKNYYNSFIGGKEVMGTDPSSYDSNSGKTVMVAPNGKKYTVDSKEVNDAKKNGWRVQ